MSKSGHAAEFVGVTHLAPLQMIAILFPVARPAALIWLRIRTDPHVAVGGRHHERVDARDLRFVFDALAIYI
jgi:hypothetical protein